MRHLIVNADDFGLSKGVNRGIIAAHHAGIVTSASLMVRQLGTRDAIELASENPELSVGLHIDLGEWTCRNGEWSPLYEVVALEDECAVRQEIEYQFAEFERITGKPPTHVDSHQHVHMQPEVRPIVEELRRAWQCPVRMMTHGIRYCGSFYGQTGEGLPIVDAIATESLLGIIASLASGVTELACHPGFDDALETIYYRERAIEVQTLCDSRVANALPNAGVALVSFAKAARLPGVKLAGEIQSLASGR